MTWLYSSPPLRRRVLAALAVWSCAAAAGVAQGPSSPDTLARGVLYVNYRLPGPVSADVVTIDLREASASLQAFQLHGLVRTSEQARALSDSVRDVLAAINADFFSFQSGWPVGNTVINGTIVRGLPSKRSHLVITGHARPAIEQVSFTGVILTSSGGAIRLAGVNIDGFRELPRLYTSAFGPDTGGDTVGVKILLAQIRDKAPLGDSAAYVVTGRIIQGRAPIPAPGAVLAIPDDVLALRGGGFLTGDTLAMLLQLLPSLPDVRQVLGGAGRILRDGRCDTLENQAREELSLKFQSDRHPRTFVGFDRDTTRIFLCTVDGRQEKSRGMSFAEMADFLLSLGAWNAVNLDGGGSTTMVVKGRVVNRPSDRTGERPVANILAVVAHP